MLYHRKVYWKESFNKQINELLSKSYELSLHVLEHLDSPNHKHNITKEELIDAIDIIKSKHVRAFECEIIDGRIMKFATRVKMQDKDISVVFLDKDNFLLIKTMWRNSEYDLHDSLDRNKYYKPLDK